MIYTFFCRIIPWQNDNYSDHNGGLFRKDIKLKYCWLSCFIFLFLNVGVLVAQTQEQAASKSGIEQVVSEPEKPVVEKPVGIPIIEISDRAKKTHIALNKIKANLEPDSDILTIKEQLPRFLSSLKRSQSGWFYKSLNSLNTRKLQDLKQEWDTNLKKLNDWEDILSGRSRKLGEDNRQLEEMSELWQLTSESVIDKETPEAVQERVRSTLDKIKDIRTRLLENMKVALTFRDQISEKQLEITKLTGLIKDAESQSRTQLFARDSLPLWKTFQAGEDSLNFGNQIRDSFANTLRMNMAYYRAHIRTPFSAHNHFCGVIGIYDLFLST